MFVENAIQCGDKHLIAALVDGRDAAPFQTGVVQRTPRKRVSLEGHFQDDVMDVVEGFASDVDRSHEKPCDIGRMERAETLAIVVAGMQITSSIGSEQQVVHVEETAELSVQLLHVAGRVHPVSRA